MKLPSNCSTDIDCYKDSNGAMLFKGTPKCLFDSAELCSKCVASKCTCMPFDPFIKVAGYSDEYNGDR